MKSAKLFIRDAAQVVAVVTNGKRSLSGKEEMNDIAVIPNGSVIVGDDGNIVAVGPAADVQSIAAGYTFAEEVDAKGKVVLPGFVDGHTHPVWSGDRAHEFALKLDGASYMEVAKAGGGIGFTTECTKNATEAELEELLLQRMDRMLAFGTTTMEGKSGYGLETETELKMLRVLHNADKTHPIDVVSTFCGAHAVPKGKNSTEQTREVIDNMIPAVIKEKQEGKNNAENIDVFCETGVFDHNESKEILAAGKAAGMHINFHGDELTPQQSGELAGELGARAVSHLEHVSDAGMEAMAKAGTFAVLLPTTAYVLRITPPPARKLIDANVPIALGSDFCPNAHSMSMPYTMNLACVIMRMSMKESLVAATINSAASIGRSDVCGSIEVGKWGDLVLLDAPLWEHVTYQMVDPPVAAVYKKGELKWSKRK